MPFNNAAAVSARPLSLHTGMHKYHLLGKFYGQILDCWKKKTKNLK